MFDESARGPPEVVAVQREDTHTLLNAVVDDVRASVLRVQRAAEETARERQHLEALAAAEAEARRQAEAQMEASRQKHAERFAEESARREREQTMLQEERQRSRQEREEQARLNAERETAERADARIVQEMWLNEQLLRHLHMQEEQHEQAWMQELKGITFQAIEHDDAKNGLLKKRYALKQKNISALARRQEESKRRRVSEQAMLTSANISLNYDLTESRELVGPERMQRLDALKTEVVEERSNMERRSVTEIGAARQCFEKLKSELLSTPDEFIDDLLCNTYWAKATGWFGEARCFSCDI